MIIRAFVVQVYESMRKKMIFAFRTLMMKPRTTLWGKEMLHKSTKYLCLLCIALVPVHAHALGFGKIKTNSALNELMDAEIPLLSASKSDISSLEITLASREVFQRFGTDRPNLLTLLKFEVKQRSGLSFIKVTSKKVIREPFLDFWIEMNSKNERIIKNFVVLLDPPHLKQASSTPSVVDAPVAEPIEPEPLIEGTVSAPQDSPFTDPEPSILDEPPAPAASSGSTEALFPAENEAVQDDDVVAAEPIEEPLEPENLIEEPLEPELETAQAVSDAVVDEPQEAQLEPIEPEAIKDEVDLALDEESDAESFVEEDGLFPRTALDEYNEPTEDQFVEPAEQELANEAPEADIANNLDSPTVDMADNETDTAVGDLDYGITKKNDNLWRIAESLRAGSSSASIYQIMMALLQSNPDAFIDNNVHRLKIGFVMRVEDKGLLTQMTRSQAAQMYAEQTEQWKSFRQDIASDVETQAVDTSEVSFTEEAAEEDPNSGELTLATPDSLEPEVSTGIEESADAQQLSDLAILRDDLKRAITEATSSDFDNPELSKKLLDLEDEINSMQRMLTVEDDELTALQQRLHEINERNAIAAEKSDVVEPEAEIEPEPVPIDEPQEITDESQMAQANPEDVGEPEEINPEEILEGDDSLTSESASDETAVAVEEKPDTTSPQAAEDTQDSGIMGMVSGVIAALISNIIYIGGAIAALVLIILVMVVLKRRNANSDGSNESILLGSEDDDNTISSLTKEVEVASAAAGPISGEVDSTSSEESSFLSDFAISGMNAIEEDNEVDPLTEADVFMAYGRYEAAEERLQDAIKTDPKRSELKLKLIELYYTTKNKEAFESTAEEFYASLGGNAGADPMWEKVLSMGAEIAPDNPIFSGGTPLEDGASVSSASMSASDVMDIGLDTGVFDSTDLSSEDTTAETALDAAATDTGGDYNFDLGIDTTGDLGRDIAKEESSGLEFDLNLDTDETSSAGGSNSLDFNLDATEEMNPTGEASLEFDLGSSLDIESAADTNIESESELMDLGLDDASGTAESTAEIDASGLDFDLPDSDLSLDDDLELSAGMDEVGTKLDLAKAYIDMGDSNGARSILDEVIDEGNDSQKQEAQELIHQIV
ncbi:hypothetical protein MNBD_GAMMA22-597 [hydrothermal vent metagenome]|uniref:FimV N-terminal domain-containing protein n=1 Tax=hydrothermal vent metagenome TaxID=652676 RepID=A0A3B0ZV09_9ZZZZ